MERLKPMDAQFVDAEDEDRHASFAIASIAVFEGPAPTYGELYAAIEGRLALVPIYRRKLRTIPFRIGPPVWVDDPNFDLHYHLRQTALPSPGGDEQLAGLIGRVMAQRLDRDFPLWEYWLVQGLAEGRWALISKVHHCMVDGISGTDLYRVIFDLSPEPAPPVIETRQVPAEPTAVALVTAAAADMVTRPARGALTLAGALSRPWDTARQAAQTGRAVARLAASAWPATESSLSGPISGQRRYAWARASLEEVKRIRRGLGGTVNDVVLAAISSGFRALLLSRGEHPEHHMVPSLIPVSTRAPGEEGSYDNRVSVVLADLPVHLADPVQRLATIQGEMAQLKAIREESAAQALITLGTFTPFPLASLLVRLAYRLPQREIVTVTTNVPGPQQQLYGLGRRLVEIIPYVPIATSLRIGVAIFSYSGQLTFGITGDYATTPDIGVLARGIERGVDELSEVARELAWPLRHSHAATADDDSSTRPSARSAVRQVTRVLGLDIGASTTRARLVADGVIEAEAAAASASLTAAGPDRAAAALTDLLAQLPELTGSLDAVCAGAAGVITAPDTRDFLRARLVPLTTSGRVVVVDDVSLVLPAADLTDGIAVISGTGSIAVGAWEGRSTLAGGWGYLLGDEGSGYWIVRSAIRELLARLGSNAPLGPLGACLLRASGARDLTQLRGMVYRQPEPWHWARHAHAVLDCADAAAARITGQAAQELARLAVEVATRLAAPDGVPVVLAGGLMGHQRLLAATTAAVAVALPASSVRALADPPVAGAVRLATAAARGQP